MQQHEYATWLLLQHFHSHCRKFTSKHFLTTIKSGTKFWKHMQQIACHRHELWCCMFLFPSHVPRWWNFTAELCYPPCLDWGLLISLAGQGTLFTGKVQGTCFIGKESWYLQAVGQDELFRSALYLPVDHTPNNRQLTLPSGVWCILFFYIPYICQH